MSVRKSLLLSALPLLWAAAALAQTPTPADPPAAAAEAPQRNGDPVQRHQDVCSDHYAHAAARLAYLEAKLDLTGKQRAAWQKWQQAELAGADKERTACLSAGPRAEGKSTALDREARIESAMAIKVLNLQSSRPALEALYEILTPAQRSVLDRPPHGEHFAPPHGMPFDPPEPPPEDR